MAPRWSKSPELRVGSRSNIKTNHNRRWRSIAISYHSARCSEEKGWRHADRRALRARHGRGLALNIDKPVLTVKYLKTLRKLNISTKPENRLKSIKSSSF